MAKQRLVGFLHSRILGIPVVSGIAGSLMLLESCTYQNVMMPATVPVAGMRPTAPPIPDGGRMPDPRYRPPMGLGELELVASAVGSASGSAMRGRIVTGPDTGPLCGIRGSVDEGIIRVHPRAAKQVPPNSWAFVFGHEFAHQTQHLAQHGPTTPALELRADIVGVEYARKAGFDLAAHLGWIFSCRNQYSDSHGDWHARAHATARHFGVSPGEIQFQADRYRRIHW
jgi:hypothetical protein